MCSVFIYLRILSQKPYLYGILGLAHNSFKSYLSNQQQFVFIPVCSSKMVSVQCPVSQGSTLGAFLFLLSINDLNSLFNEAIIVYFADDTHLNYGS